MTGCFVRALWGDEYTQAHPGTRPRPCKTRMDVRAALQWPNRLTSPVAVYSFGVANQRFLEKLGVRSVMLSDEYLPGCFSGDDRNVKKHGQVHWGVNPFKYKIDAIADALKTYPDVVWLDWDVEPVAPEPPDLWEKLAWDQPLQAAVRTLRARSAKWRTGDEAGMRVQHHGAFVYIRGRETVRRLQTLVAERPTETEEHAIGRLVDEMMGGRWLGLDTYREMGFVPYCYDVGDKHNKVWDAEEVVFMNRGR